MRRVIYFYVILIIIFSIEPLNIYATPKQISINNQTDNNSNNSVWSIQSSAYMNIQEQNGVFVGIYDHSAPQVNEWRTANAVKSLHNYTGLEIDADFQFNFALMGQIYLYGFDNNGTTLRWVAGYVDAWSQHAGVPTTQSWQSNGTLYPQSFPVNDPERNTAFISSSSGTGHISINYLSSNMIYATVIVDGETLSRVLPVSGPIDIIKIEMGAVGSYNALTDFWEAYNYNESTFLYKSIPSNLLISTNPSISIQDLAVIGIIIVLGVIILTFSYTKLKTKKNTLAKKAFIEQSQNKFPVKYEPNILKTTNPNICPRCLHVTLLEDIFCSNCGVRLK